MLGEVSRIGIVWPLLIIKKKNAKMKIHYPVYQLPYKEVLQDIIRTLWAEQCGTLLRVEIPWEGTSLPSLKPE